MKQESKLDWFYRVAVPKATSVGASVVIVGALFKIQHLPGAGIMLGVGLIVEAIIFFMGAFQPPFPPEAHYNWERVYPELEEDPKGVLPQKKLKDDKKPIKSLVSIDKLIEEANLGPDVFKTFGAGMKNLHSSVNQMKDLSNVTTASNHYNKSLQIATKSMGELTKTFGGTVTAIGAMTSSVKDAKEYHGQVQTITKNLGALNAVYEMELKDANSHLKAMNKFYNNLTVAMESMSDASKESKMFKDQMSALTTNLLSLNKVYGNMLSAMRS